MKLKDIPKKIGEIEIDENKIKNNLAKLDRFLIVFGKICTILILLSVIFYIIFSISS